MSLYTSNQISDRTYLFHKITLFFKKVCIFIETIILLTSKTSDILLHDLIKNTIVEHREKMFLFTVIASLGVN